MLKIILIDDELNAIKGLLYELKQFSNSIEVVQTFSNAQDAITFLENEDIDAVFLDMEMPTMTGLSFLKHFNERNFEVVFTTAHNSYAIDAVREDAVDYLLKPIDPDELKKCIDRLEKKIFKNSMSSQLVDAIDKLTTLNNSNRKIKLNYDGKIEFFSPEDLLYFEASGNYTKVHTAQSNHILLTKKLKILEEELPHDLFFRIHNSYIINLSRVKLFHKNDGLIILDNGTELPVSKQRRANILDKM